MIAMRAVALAVILLTQADALRVQGGVVTGTIRNPDGTPASGVRVTAISAPNTATAITGDVSLVSIAQTDANGRYRLEGIPPGRYYIGSGPLDLPVYYPGVRARANARIVVVTPGAALQNIDFVFVPPAEVTVRGRVVGNTPPDVFQVTIRRQTAPISGIAGRATVNPDGTFELSRVGSGPYELDLSLLQLQGNRDAGVFLADTPETTIEVGDINIDGITLTAPPMITGRVEVEDGKPLPVSVGSPSNPNAPSLLRLTVRPTVPPRVEILNSSFAVRADGRFILFLLPGQHTIDVFSLPIGYDLQSMSYGDSDLVREPFVVPAKLTGAEPEIRVRLKSGRSAGVQITGVIVDPPADTQTLHVSLQTIAPVASGKLVQQRAGEAPVAADGTFQIIGVPWGSYTVRPISANQVGTPVTILVTDRDVAGVRLAWPPPALTVEQIRSQESKFSSPERRLQDIPLRSPSIPSLPNR